MYLCIQYGGDDEKVMMILMVGNIETIVLICTVGTDSNEGGM